MLPIDVFKKIQDDYGYSRKTILGTSRLKDVAFARHVAMFLLTDSCGLSSVKAGIILHKSHGQVLRGRDKIRNKVKIGALDFGCLINEKVREISFYKIIDELLVDVGNKIKTKHKVNPDETLIKILNALKD